MLTPAAAVAATPPPRRARLFAEAATVGEGLYKSFPDGIWAQRVLVTLQTFAVPLAFWFKPICVAIALFWLVYRASQVLKKPLDELASLLGFDIPLTPLIDLASIKADGAIIHWTLPAKQKQKNSLKYEIWLNGGLIDTVSIHESAVSIVGLQPASFYVVRIGLVNNLEFGSKSAPIRFRTKPAASGDCFILPADGHETDQDGANDSIPRIRAYHGLKDITPPSATSATMEREPSSGMGARRSLTGRRSSPGMIGTNAKHDPPAEYDGEPPEGAETIPQLTARLDALRLETEELNKQQEEEEAEEKRQRDELILERNKLRDEVAEKERTSKSLKKDLNNLERQNTGAQNERNKQERLLQMKKQERQKLKDDTVKWQRETEQMKGDVQRIQQDKEDHLKKVAKEKDELREKLSEEARKTKALDDEIKNKMAEIKKVDRTIKSSTPNGAEPETNLVEQFQKDAEEDRQYNNYKNKMLLDYQNLYQKLEDAKRFYSEQHRYLETLRAEQRRQEEMAQYNSPPPPERLPRRGDSQRSRHAPSRHSTSDSPRLTAFPPVSQSPFSNPIGTAPAGFNTTGFMNIRSGMTINPTDDMGMSDEDKEKLTGGAPMSPGVETDLLPADLFNTSDDKKDMRQAQQVSVLAGLGSLPGLGGPAPPLPPPQTQQQQELFNPGPASPNSVSSRSPSVFASPLASQNNLYMGSPENAMDSDRRSIRSTRSNRATSGGNTGSRFSVMFGIKQRSKTSNLSDEIAGPPLSKANSMPRQDPFVPGLDGSVARKRNSSISGSTSFPEGGTAAGDGGPNSTVARRAFGNIFSKDRASGWPSSFTGFGRRPASPRPGSTHSNELPRPSMDSSQFGGWPSSDAASGARSSPLAFGPGWNAPGGPTPQGRLYGSRHPSRRPSVQYGASGPPEDIMEDSDSGSEDDEPARQQAPIGTSRPAPGTETSSPKKTAGGGAAAAAEGAKLNPNAKDFKSFFSSMKLPGSTKKDAATAGASTSPGPSAAFDTSTTADESPPQSRKSRDTRSMNTTESSLLEPSGSHSNRNSNDLARVPSYSASSTRDDTGTAPSPSLAGSSQGKESFMQKITRKSSSGKFSLPNFSVRGKSRLDPGASATSSPAQSHTLGEGDEDTALEASVGSLHSRDNRGLGLGEGGKEGTTGNRGSGRWGKGMLKLGRKDKKEAKGDETPSLSGSGMSVASETEGDGESDSERTEGEDDAGEGSSGKAGGKA